MRQSSTSCLPMAFSYHFQHMFSSRPPHLIITTHVFWLLACNYAHDVITELFKCLFAFPNECSNGPTFVYALLGMQSYVTSVHTFMQKGNRSYTFICVRVSVKRAKCHKVGLDWKDAFALFGCTRWRKQDGVGTSWHDTRGGSSTGVCWGTLETSDCNSASDSPI